MDWTDKQVMAARAITLIKRRMEPKCSECGYGAARPKCAMDMGGYCPRHNQEDLLAFNSVIDAIEKAADFPKDHDQRWDLYMPLDLYQEFDDTERALLLDLHEAGGKLTSRSCDERYNSLSSKRACSFSSQYGKWNIEISPRGKQLAEQFKAETGV